MALLSLLLACADKRPEEPAPEPLDLPADPAESGVPVGVQTLVDGSLTIEVWYPAADAERGSVTELVDFSGFVPETVTAVLGPVAFPAVPSGAIRNAAFRPPETPYPVVVFSHGFGGMRLQSLDYAVHLASRGYFVVAADHPGRMLGDVLPCAFSPQLDGCDLSAFAGVDAAIDDDGLLADWVEGAANAGPFAGAIDPARMALTGHSAGGGTVQNVSEIDDRFVSLLAMASDASPANDTPLLLLGGTCDGIVTDSRVLDASTRAASTTVRIHGAGHLAFADLCELDLRGFGEELLAGRDDVDTFVLEQLLLLGSDGCANGTPAVDECAYSGFLPLETSDPIIRAASTLWLDQTLRGSGPGVEALDQPEVELGGAL